MTQTCLAKLTCVLLLLSAFSNVHAQSFEERRKKDAENVQIRAEPGPIDVDGKQTVVLKFQIKPKWEIYAHEVRHPLLTEKTTIKVTGPDVLESRIDYPVGVEENADEDRYWVYKGEFTIPVHVVRSLSMPRRPFEISVHFRPDCPSMGRCGFPTRVPMAIP